MKKVLSVLITAALMLQLLVMFGAVSAEGSTAMTVTNASGTVGSTVTVEVGIANNPGFHALQCEIEYDASRMKLIGIAVGESLVPPSNLGINDYFVSSTESAMFIYKGVDVNESTQQIVSHLVTGDVTVATLTFEMLAAGDASVTVNCIASVELNDSFQNGMNTFDTDEGSGTVSIAEKPAYTPGNFNGDDFVDIDDAIYLLMYTMFPDFYPINQGADYNADGNVDIDDAIYLLMYTMFPDFYPLG